MRIPDTDRQRPMRGFTLLEVLAAMVFLSILVPVIVAALTLSNRTSEITQRRAVAAELAENELDQQLTGNAWQSASATQGDFGSEYPGFRWEMAQEQWQGDQANPMTQLSIEVFFPVQGKEQSVKLATLVSTSNAQFQPQNVTPMAMPSPTP